MIDVVTQLFTFNGEATNIPLVPQNGNNQTIFTIINGALAPTAASPDSASGNELFTFQ